MFSDPATALSSLMLAVFVAAIVIAVAWDIAKLEIPNTISVVLILAFLAGGLAGGIGWVAMLSHLGAGIAALFVGVFLHRFGVWGGGDVKLAAALAIWFGWVPLMNWLLLVAIIGGILAVVILVYRQLPLPDTAPAWLLRLHAPSEGIPYGVAIGSGALLVWDDALRFLATVSH